MNTLVIALLLACPLAAQDEIVKESDHEFTAEPSVLVRSIVGSVRVHGWDKKTAHLKTVVRGRDRALVTVEIDADKERLHINERHPERRDRYDVEVEIHLQVPRALKSLALNAVSGSIDAEDVRAKDFEIASISASVRLARFVGDLKLSAISARTRLEDVSGAKAEVNLTSADLEGTMTFGTTDVSTISGGVSLELAPPKEGAWRLEVSTISGNVGVRLPAAAGARLSATSLSGDLRCGFDLKDERRRREIDRSLSGTFGDGTGTIKVKSISADIAIDKKK